MSDDIILIAHMLGSLLDLNKNKYDILNIYPGLNGNDKPLNKWQKYVEFNDNGKKLQSKGDYFDPINKNRGNDEDCHATLRINSVEYEAKYLFVREIECPDQAVDSILQESNS